MEILGDDDEADVAAWTPAGTAAPPRAPGRTGYSRDTVDRTGIPLRAAAPAAQAPELDLGEQAADQQRAGYQPRQSDLRHAEPVRPAEPARPADPRPGLQDPEPPVDIPAVPAVPDPEPDDPAGLRDKLIGVVLSAEALGLSGVTTALACASSTIPSVLAFTRVDGSPSDQITSFAFIYGLAGVLVVALGVLGVARLRPGLGTPAGRALTGASVLLGLLLIGLAAYLAVLAGDLPGPTDDGGTVS